MNNILIIGPQPPAIGGIATIVSLLKVEFEGTQGVCFINSSKKEREWEKLLLPFSLLLSIGGYCLRNRKSRVLFFSSGHRSFWEKILWLLVARMGSARVYIVMVDGNFPSFYKTLPSVFKAIARIVMRQAIVVGQSHRWGQYFHTIFPKSEIKLITGAVDTDFFCPIVKSGKKDGPISILYVGWVAKAKGIYDLLMAVKMLNDMKKDFHIDLAGPIYEDVNRLNGVIEEYGIESRITLCGPIESREILRDKYRASDIFVLPSHAEGFPVALLEAVSSGLPCVGTNVGGIPDILEEGRCGFLVEKCSPKAVTDALCKLIDDETLRSELELRARERAVQNYSLAISMNSYKNLLLTNE